jgi:hypothetical protein
MELSIPVVKILGRYATLLIPAYIDCLVSKTLTFSRKVTLIVVFDQLAGTRRILIRQPWPMPSVSTHEHVIRERAGQTYEHSTSLPCISSVTHCVLSSAAGAT